MMEFLLSNIKRDSQTFRLVMMCPDTLEIFRNWMEKFKPSSFDIFPCWTSLARIVNDYKVSGLLKGSTLRRERLATYCQNLTSGQLDPKRTKTNAMREVFEELEVGDEMFEATRLPEVSYLLFFFHVDIIETCNS